MGKKIVFESAFNSYTTQSILGEGGSGVVYEVVDDAGQSYALKRLRPTYITSERRKRFKNEIFFCEKNTHPNIITILDSGFQEIEGTKCPFYVMLRYTRTLRHLINDGIPQNQILPRFAQILDGVEAAHLKKVWHRDLKPENILYDEQQNLLVLADFGIAHFSQAELETLIETKPGMRLANFQYAAPEQRVKGRVVDRRADIYALGLILNEMFTGEIIQGSEYKTIGSVAADFAYLDEVVNRMIRQDPGDRLGIIDEVKKELIARKNQFVSRQKLDTLRKEVVPRASVDDYLVEHPIQIERPDYQRGSLFFELSAAPNSDWIAEFRESATSFIPGVCEPSMFRFRDNSAQILLNNSNNAQRIVELFKSYVESANNLYRKRREREARERERRENEELKKRVQEAELRDNLLKNLKL